MRKFLIIALIVICTIVFLSYTQIGGGIPLTEEPILEMFPPHQLIQVHEFDQPPGNIAVDEKGNIAVCFHPEAQPKQKLKVLLTSNEILDLPNEWFDTVMSLRFDRNGFLWTLDHGMHGLRKPRLLQIDIQKIQILREIKIAPVFAPLGSNLNDFQIAPNEDYIFIADTSFLRNRPGILIVNLQSGEIKRVLDHHETTQKGPYYVSVDQQPVGHPPFVTMRPGIDSIAIDRRGEWLYYGSMSDTKLYRVRVADLLSLEANELGKQIEFYSNKPLSDGLTIDDDNNIYVSQIQSNSVSVIDGKTRQLKLLLKSPDLQWPDGFSFGPNQTVFVSASYLHHVAFQAPGAWKDRGPFRIFKFAGLTAARAGQ